MDFISARMGAEDGWGGREGQPEVEASKKGPDITRCKEIVTISPKASARSPRPAAQSGSLPDLHRHDKEIHSCSRRENYQEEKHCIGPEWSWEDQLLKTREGPAGKRKRGKTILWRPGSGRHVDEGRDSYRPFTHVSRVVHLGEALDICFNRRMKPKKVQTFSSIDSRELPADHPCANMKVLWFGADNQAEEEPSNWYGNVEFALDAQILLTQWKYCFWVEMMTAPTHTASRILLTNKDYSSVLPRFYSSHAGGPWQVTPEGHKGLVQCSRYRFMGTNVHSHALEFMIEATPEDERAILAACQISFKNHDRAKHMNIPHVCNRHQRLGTPCPTPFNASQTAREFFKHIQRSCMPWSRLPGRLSPEAQKQLEFFNEDERRIAMQKYFVSPPVYSQQGLYLQNQMYYF
ncbi:uncharacterized protein LOC125028068 [Penaeus chinensis]|uniref:uncharacterized protein LOC125028068 n=1 Tax=Penaeus chinensis TaxID=139456 RepID=UPI001FB7047E|nr:uncharacterized protein LOC125028068 [Penaeus chinensis]